MGIIAAIGWTCQDEEGSRAQVFTTALGPPGAHRHPPSLLCTRFQFGVLSPALHTAPSLCLSCPHRTVSTPRFLFCSLPCVKTISFGTAFEGGDNCSNQNENMFPVYWLIGYSYVLLEGSLIGCCLHDIVTFRFLHLKQINVNYIWIHIKYVMHTHQYIWLCVLNWALMLCRLV